MSSDMKRLAIQLEAAVTEVLVRVRRSPDGALRTVLYEFADDIGPTLAQIRGAEFRCTDPDCTDPTTTPGHGR